MKTSDSLFFFCKEIFFMPCVLVFSLYNVVQMFVNCIETVKTRCYTPLEQV